MTLLTRQEITSRKKKSQICLIVPAGAYLAIGAGTAMFWHEPVVQSNILAIATCGIVTALAATAAVLYHDRYAHADKTITAQQYADLWADALLLETHGILEPKQKVQDIVREHQSLVRYEHEALRQVIDAELERLRSQQQVEAITQG